MERVSGHRGAHHAQLRSGDVGARLSVSSGHDGPGCGHAGCDVSGATRVWVGHGEALNEHVVGGYWPEAPERISRMFEAIELTKKLFAASIAGRDVSFSGDYYRMESARLWTMPPVAQPLLVATSGPATAQRAGRGLDATIAVPSVRGSHDADAVPAPTRCRWGFLDRSHGPVPDLPAVFVTRFVIS